MALYTLVSKEQALNPLINYNGNDTWVRNQMASMGYGPSAAETQMYNMLGRDAGSQTSNDNFFTKKASSIGNAVGTTLSAPISLVHDIGENVATQKFLGDSKSRMNDIAKKYGYNSYHDVWDAQDKAEAEGDQTTLDFIKNTINPELQAQANANAEEATAKAKGYEDYRKNNLISKNINQDRGKFLGSAINTLSTAVDIAGLGANPLTNAIQGGVEGVADELEQNGLQNFDWGRAGQNAAIGAATGAVTGALNKGVSNALAKNGGNLFKGGNALTRGLNNLGSSTALGRIGSTVATGAGRGALSGAVGGATGAGLSAAMNGRDVLDSALQGAAQGAQQGAFTGATMAGANMAINKTPGVGKFMRDVNQAQEDWRKSGSNFDERLTNTLTSGDSAVGEWLQGNRQSRLLNTAGAIGNSIRDYTSQGMGPRKAEAAAYEDLIRDYYDEDMGGIEGALRDAEAAAYPGDSNFRKAQRLVEGGSLGVSIDDAFEGLKSVYGDDFNPDVYLNKDGSYKYKDGEPYVWTVYKNKIAMNLANKLDAMDAGTYAGEPDTPTTAAGWLKKAGERIVEDANNRGVGLSLKDVSGNESYDQALNRGMNEGLSGPELGDRLAQYSNLPDKMNGNTLYRMAQSDPDLRNAVSYVAAQIADEGGQAPTYSSIAGDPDYWTEVRSQYAQAKNYQGPGDYFDGMNKYTMDNPNTPETEVYRTLTGESEPLRTSKEYEYRQKRNQKLLDQYGTIDKPTAKAVRATETVGKIADAGFEKPADVEAVIKKITGSDGAVNKLNRKVIANAGQINTMDGVDNGTSLTDFVDQQIRMNGLYGTNDGNALATEIEAVLNQLPSRRDGTITGLDSAEDAFDVVQMLEKHSANYKGRSGSNYATSNPYKEQKAAVIDAVATVLKDRIYDASDVSQVVTPDVIADMKSWYPKNEKWAEWVDQNIATAKTGADLRAAQAPFVRMGRLIDNTIVNSGTFGSKVPRQLLRIATSNPLGVLINGAEMAAETPIGNRASAWVYDKLADRAARREASNPTPTPAPTPTPTPATGEPTPTPTPTTNTATAAANPSTQIFNAIGRNEGLSNGEQARTAQYLANATNTANPQVPTTGTLEGLITPTVNMGSTDVYDSVYGTTPTATTATMGAGTGATASSAGQYFQPTGDYWADLLGRALSSAIEADDVEAFGALFGMYQDAISKLQSNATKGSGEKLTATQQRANAALNSLGRLSQMTPDLGYNLSNIPVIGDIATFGGNDYESEAKSLAQQIGYMVSGANIKEEEAYNIGKAYVPQPFDSETTRRNKLQRAREIIAQYQNGYATE